MNKQAINYQSQMRNWERWRDFELWKSAQTMTLLFGEGFLYKIPPLPREFEAYALRWLERELELVQLAGYVPNSSAIRILSESKKI